MKDLVKVEEKKRKEEAKEQKEPEKKRRRTQEEIDWHDYFWSSEDRASRDISILERYDIEGRIDRWIQEIEEDAQESLK
eukprot:2055979-Karenia_brevis.AAC.1